MALDLGLKASTEVGNHQTASSGQRRSTRNGHNHIRGTDRSQSFRQVASRPAFVHSTRPSCRSLSRARRIVGLETPRHASPLECQASLSDLFAAAYGNPIHPQELQSSRLRDLSLPDQPHSLLVRPRRLDPSPQRFYPPSFAGSGHTSPRPASAVVDCGVDNRAKGSWPCRRRDRRIRWLAMATRWGNARDRRGSGSITWIVKTLEWRDKR